MRTKSSLIYFVLYLLFAMWVSSIAACKKSAPEKEAPESPTTGNRTQFTLDSIFLYAKHTYVWNAALPNYADFNPRKYNGLASDLLNFKKEVFELSRYAPNPLTKLPYEHTTLPGLAKYSYIEVASGDVGKIAATNAVPDESVPSALVVGTNACLSLKQFRHLKGLKAELDAIFSDFAGKEIMGLIIDLRGNSGGYVETAQYLADLIANTAMNGKVMYSEHFNAELQQGKAGILKNQPYLDENNKQVYVNGRKATYADIDFSVKGNTFLFEKKGKLNTLNTIYFLVNGGTASASELLINSLRPYFNTMLIGSRTYGKPVGSFGIRIDHHTLYITNFLIRNAQGAGDYFEGLPADISVSDSEIGNEMEQIINNTLALANGKKQVIFGISRIQAEIMPFKRIANPVMIKQELKLKP
ncbi:S41 family peptidase [Pedobacter frigoris]|uniref:S41 family peptidase n=1 Tax=Pedobacter frigoris TaxID=2571272 RepID=UPI0029303310|nr:S41 family peptidase [Pedobacter frigoris]